MMRYTVLLLSLLHLTLCHPATTSEEIKLPDINNPNPVEINSAEYDNKKVFIRTVGNFERSINYLDKTVREVESLINTNSTLPRLTRGEILEIIENITKADLLDAQDKLNNKSKDRAQKAVMLVMPYTPSNEEDAKIQDLYTKPPVTKMVSDSLKTNETVSKPYNKRRRRPTSPTTRKPQGAFYGEVFPEPLPNLNLKPSTKKPNFGEKSPKPISIRSTTTTTEPEPEITTYRPVQDFLTERQKYRRRSTTTRTPPTTSTEISVIINNDLPKTAPPKRRRRPSRPPQRYPNHKYPEDSESTTTKNNEGLNIVDSPKLGTATTSKLPTFSYATVPPARPSKPHSFTTAKPFLSGVNLPDDLKSTFEDLQLDDSYESLKKQRDPVIYESEDTYARPPPLNDNVKDLLASIGVLPTTTSTTTMIPGISNVADTLSPDMKELLMSFGLLPDPNYKENPQNTKEEPIGVPTAEIKPDSYIQFKPLPDSGPARSEMEELLERFGLGRSKKDSRRQKGINVDKPPKVLTQVPTIDDDILPENMKDIVSELGVGTRDGKKIRGGALEKTMEKNNVSPPEATKDELEKLNQLLDIIKQLEKLNGTASDDDLKKIDFNNLKNLMGSLNKDELVPLDEQEWAPDPLNYDYGLSKNEVKRQENKSESVTPSSTTTTTEAVEVPNIKDLEDSFGGSSDSEAQVTLPPPTEAPKTGFYYLLDWNSFFEIDDQKGKRVNLRFQPHSGDPKRFYSVNVP